MAEKRVSVRISSQGGKELKAELVDIGQKGSTAFRQVEESSRRVGPALQNTAYQIGDVFTQVASGTDPMRAIAIQLPQLLGGMGLIGAVAGAAAAGLIPLWNSFRDGKSDAERLGEAAKGLSDALRDLHSATNEAAKGPMDLAGKYGDLSVQAMRVLEIQRQMAEVRATRAFGETASALGAAFGGRDFLENLSASDLQALSSSVDGLDQKWANLNDRIAAFGEINSEADQARWDSLQQERANLDEVFRSTTQYRYELDQLAAQFGITAAQAGDLAIAAARVREADNTQDRLAAAQQLADEIWRSTDGLADASDETVTLYYRLTDALLAGMDLAALDIATGIGAAADEALRLSYNLSAAVARSPAVGFQPGQGLSMSDGSLAYPVVPKAAGKGRKAGGGGGGRDDAVKEAQKIYEETRTEAEKYSAELARLDALLSGGYLAQDTYNRAVDQLEEKYHKVGNAAKGFADINSQLKDAILDLAAGGEASFDKIAQSIRRAALQAALFGEGPFGKLFGSGEAGGGLLGMIGKALGLKSFDGGGYTGSGARVGGVDGRGGYLALLHPEEHVTDLTRMRRAAGSASGGSGGSGAVIQLIDQRKSGAAIETERRTGPDGREIIVATVRDAENRGDLDGSKRRYGLRPALVRR